MEENIVDFYSLTTNNVWMMICTGLVFFMHLGFTFLESGMTRQKNTVNILFKISLSSQWDFLFTLLAVLT